MLGTRLQNAGYSCAHFLLGSNVTSATTRRVRIVDDNVDAGELVAELLRLHGANTIFAANGETALILASAFQPHIVFLDIGMPRMDGFALLKRMKALSWDSSPRFVALTAWNDADIAQRIVEAGFDRHVQKPASITTLLSELQ